MHEATGEVRDALELTGKPDTIYATREKTRRRHLETRSPRCSDTGRAAAKHDVDVAYWPDAPLAALVDGEI